MVPSRATAALLQNPIRSPATLSATASTAPERGVDAEQPRGARRRPGAARRGRSRGRAGGRRSRRPGRPVAPSWLIRQIAPSSVPVNTDPSSGPWVATTTSSAPGPGTGTTVMLCWDSWGVVTRSCWRRAGESRNPGTTIEADAVRSRARAAAGATKTIRRPSPQTMSASVRSTSARRRRASGRPTPYASWKTVDGAPRAGASPGSAAGRRSPPASSRYGSRLGRVLAVARRARPTSPHFSGSITGNSSRSWSRIQPRRSTRTTPAKRRVRSLPP